MQQGDVEGLRPDLPTVGSRRRLAPLARYGFNNFADNRLNLNHDDPTLRLAAHTKYMIEYSVLIST
jgi:hypothetical protein